MTLEELADRAVVGPKAATDEPCAEIEASQHLELAQGSAPEKSPVDEQPHDDPRVDRRTTGWLVAGEEHPPLIEREKQIDEFHHPGLARVSQIVGKPLAINVDGIGVRRLKPG
ncbi:MAG: hypothetical protein QM765_46345 [Myxococcales bacterium]